MKGINMINPYKGETELQIGDDIYCMVFNMPALFEIEEKVLSLPELLKAIQRGGLNLRQVVSIAEILVGQSGETFPMESFLKLPPYSIIDLTKNVAAALTKGFTAKTGDVAEEKDADEDEKEDEGVEEGETPEGKPLESLSANENEKKDDGIVG